jgi:protein phosphatase
MKRFQAIYSAFSAAMAKDVSAYEADPSKLVLPILPFQLLSELIKAAEAIFSKEETVLNISEDVIIVGDLHGQILDLFRIIMQFGRPPKTKYLFLGDYVDRGQFSTETSVLLLTMKVLWPSSVFMIRGNHEFSPMWAQGRFAAELASIYPNENATAEFEKAFSMMPLAAIVNKKVICLHGGISPKVTTIATIASVKRPIQFFKEDIATDIVWSDPTETTEEFAPSDRRIGQLFGEAALTRFLANNEMELLVRGHQSEEEGYGYHLNGKILTVFSASRYCNVMSNKAAVLIAKRKSGSNLIPQTFEPINWILRRQVNFVNIGDQCNLEVNAKDSKMIQRSAAATTPFPQQSSSASLDCQISQSL